MSSRRSSVEAPEMDFCMFVFGGFEAEESLGLAAFRRRR